MNTTAAEVEPELVPPKEKFTFGAKSATASMRVAPRSARSAALTAVIAMGVDCRLSSVRRAVTTTSCNVKPRSLCVHAEVEHNAPQTTPKDTNDCFIA